MRAHSALGGIAMVSGLLSLEVTSAASWLGLSAVIVTLASLVRSSARWGCFQVAGSQRVTTISQWVSGNRMALPADVPPPWRCWVHSSRIPAKMVVSGSLVSGLVMRLIVVPDGLTALGPGDLMGVRSSQAESWVQFPTGVAYPLECFL